MYNELAANIALLFVFVGFNMTFLSQFLLGFKGMPRRYYTYLDQFQPLHGFSSIGALVMGAGFVIMAVYLFYALFKGQRAPANPWGSLTLEWTIPSPPSTHNFSETPIVEHGPYDYDRILPKMN